MSASGPTRLRVAIACGGTGGHLFPGLAVGEELRHRGCEVQLLISPKQVDQQAVKAVTGMTIATLPGVGLSGWHFLRFAAGFWNSYLAARRLFAAAPPQAVLAMGGFTAAPPVLAGKRCGAATFLHESNAIPGKANRWLAGIVDRGFVGFPSAAARMRCRSAETTGTPVRAQFRPGDVAARRSALGLEPVDPVLLVMGGSQGASAINDLVVRALPIMAKRLPALQYLHLAGPADAGRVKTAYAQFGRRAVVRGFLAEMDQGLGAATVAVSRSGASSLAELAAMRLPSILIPYPFAADDHQFYNARLMAEQGAAVLLPQPEATPQGLADRLTGLVLDPGAHASMSHALGRCHRPDSAGRISERILETILAKGLWDSTSNKADAGQTPLRDPQCALT